MDHTTGVPSSGKKGDGIAKGFSYYIVALR